MTPLAGARLRWTGEPACGTEASPFGAPPWAGGSRLLHEAFAIGEAAADEC